MIIIIDKLHNAIWHRDCPKNKNKSGVMMNLNDDDFKKTTLIKCLHCNEYGLIPYGTAFQTEQYIDKVC